MRMLLIFVLSFVGQIVFAQENPLFSIQGGIYQKSLEVELTDTVNQIFYTLDGSRPSSHSKKYTHPFSVEKTTVIRAAVYKDGTRGKIETQTYIIGRTYDMAVISIAVNPDDFFNYDRGIYVKGCCADSVSPYRGANFWKGWERKINIEFYEPSGELGFNQQTGVRIFGGFSKGLPMKSLAIISRKKYEKRNIKYQIFPDKEIKKFKSIILRSSGSDFNNTHFRDALLTNLIESLDVEIQAYRPAVVYVNGKYWGIHNVREKINEEYLRRNCGANPDSVDIMKHRNDLLVGSRDNYLTMKKYMSKTNFSDTAEIHHLNTLMEIDNFINYNITEVYIDNRDAGGNIRFWRPQTPEGRWRWILFDTDISFGISDWKAYKKNTLDKMTRAHDEIWPDPPWSTFIIRQLLENDSIKNVYINRFADHLNTIFSTEVVHFKIDSIQKMLQYEMPFHLKRWRSSNIGRWERNIGKMKDFATKRPDYVRMHLIERFGLTDTFSVEVRIPNFEMGYVQLNSIHVTDSFKGVYFIGAPVSIKAIPADGYKFVKWEGNNEVLDGEFMLASASVLVPVFEKKELSNFNNVIGLNEFSTHQDSTITHGDWVELYNVSEEDVDISGWKLKSEDGVFIFPKSSLVKSKNYLVLARYPDEMKKVYAEINISKSSLNFGISSEKDQLILFDSEKHVVDSLRYDFTTEFNEILNSQNRNLEKPKQNFISNWKISKQPTPGEVNDLFEPEIVEQEESKNELWIYIGGGTLVFGILLIIILLLNKRKSKK